METRSGSSDCASHLKYFMMTSNNRTKFEFQRWNSTRRAHLQQFMSVSRLLCICNFFRQTCKLLGPSRR